MFKTYKWSQLSVFAAVKIKHHLGSFGLPNHVLKITLKGTNILSNIQARLLSKFIARIAILVKAPPLPI